MSLKNVRAVVLDTGCCNLYSLLCAIRRLGVEPVVSREAAVIRSADRLFLPGVGTARAAMDMIAERGLTELIREARVPTLGICLGMQILGEFSEETGGVELLGLIHSDVRLMDPKGEPLPHMGWNSVTYREGEPLFRGIAQGTHFYFVHSYAMPVGSETVAECVYGNPFSASVRGGPSGLFTGVQFHPERSGAAGARLIRNFLEAPE